MYMTDFNGKRYVFFDDRVTVNGIPIPYAEMTNIAHRRGDVPAFLFDYKGRRFALPYRLDEIRSILPYFQKAAGIGVNTADVAQPATVEYAAPEPIAEPAVAAEPAVMEYPASEPVQTEYAAQEPAMVSEPAVFDAPVISTPYEESYVDSQNIANPYAPPAPFESAPASDDVVTFEDSAAFAEPYATDTETLTEPVDAFATVADSFAVDTASFAEPTDSYASDAEPLIDPSEPFADSAESYAADADPFAADADDLIADADPFAADVDNLAPDNEFDIFSSEADTLAPDDGSDIFALGDEAPAAEDLSKKRFWTPVKIIIAALVAVAILVVILFSCHKGGASDTQESSQDIQTPVTEETAAPEDADQEQAAAAPAAQGDAVEATDGFTAGDEDGTMQVVLKKAYVGDAALDKLAEMGENKADYTEDDDPGYKLVLYEYEVNVTEGMLIGDPITGEMFLPDRTTEMDDWYSYDLTVNQDKDLAAGELELDTGAKTTVYCAYGMPANLTEYYEKVYTDASENTIWVHYVLE